MKKTGSRRKEFFKEGLRFECTKCGECCKGEGIVRVNEEEIEEIAKYLKKSRKEIIDKYTIKLGKEYVLKDHIYEGEKSCIFYERECLIYPVRPLQCKTYPFWPSILSSEKNWEKEKRFCEGINQGKLHSYEEIIEKLQKMLERR